VYIRPRNLRVFPRHHDDAANLRLIERGNNRRVSEPLESRLKNINDLIGERQRHT